MPNLNTSETPVSPTTKTGSQSHSIGEDTLFQAMLKVLERVARPGSGSRGRGSVTERLRSNGAKLFRGVTRVASTVAEYLLEATERIMNDIDCTPKQKLKGAVSLLRDKGKYVGVSYVDARKCKFMNLTQGDRSVVEYEVEFLRLSHYTRGMVASKYEKCVRFEDGLRDNLMVLIAPQREREFTVLVGKAKIAEKVKHVERQNRDRERGKSKRDSKTSSSVQRPKEQARPDGPIRVGVPIAPNGIQPCGGCGRRHPDECWRRLGTCLMCGSLEHHIRECPQQAD
ncbi:uncharacterized protein LOC105771997 [Gossypium raimondii]|uniref:uncharacterized protein LOC105771997 n=1 Tax=Gossypium raimondii TaxID=29730 RepID=UPI00063B0474|nr:uncharacterized protein LOC105771997 [Gossypium raimondii]